MAKEVITRLIDDITKEPVEDGSGESIRFSVGGQEYEIDLSAKNAKKFHETMKFYTDHAAEVEPAPSAPPGAPRARRAASAAATRSTKMDKEQLAAMRTWLRANGHEVSDRGRIAQSLQDIYNEAHK